MRRADSDNDDEFRFTFGEMILMVIGIGMTFWGGIFYFIHILAN